MKYCNECGFGCDDLARFCTICGHQFKIETEHKEVEKEPDVEATTLLLDEPVVDNVQQELEKALEDNTPEYYKQEMLQNKQMIDDLMKQQQQLQMQLDTMKKQQWKQAELQQKQQNQLKEYRYQVVPQPVVVPQASSNRLKNKWSLIGAIVCILSHIMGDFVVYDGYRSELNYGVIEFCQRVRVNGYYGDTAELIVVWITAMFPLLSVALIVVLAVSSFCEIPTVRLWLSIANIIGIVATFLFILMEGGGDYVMGVSFWCMIIGIGLGTYSCVKGDMENSNKLAAKAANGPDFNIGLIASEVSLERGNEWRCPKCDTRNSKDYKFCKTCGTSRT